MDYWTYIKKKGWVSHTYYKKSETNAMKCNRPLKEIMEKYPKKLFVYASGNYAMDAIKFNGIFHKYLIAGASNLSTNLLSSSNDNILIVGSVLNDGTLPYSSNYGDSVDIVAPTSMKSLSRVIVGMSTYLELKSDNSPYYGTYHENTESLIFNGTSAAAPAVTGVASLIYSLNPDFTPQEVKKILIDSATNSAKERHTTLYYETNVTEKIPAGHDIPILDAGEALQMAQDIMNGKIVNVAHYYPSFFSPECRIFISSANKKLNLESPVLAVRGQRVDNDTLEAIDSNSLPNIESMSVRSFNTNRIYKKYIVEGYVKINGITNATRFKNEFEDIKVVPVKIRDKATGEALNGAKITVESMNLLNDIAKLFNRKFDEDKIVDGDTIDLYLRKDYSYKLIIEKEGYKKYSEIYTDDLASFTVEMEPEGQLDTTFSYRDDFDSLNKDFWYIVRMGGNWESNVLDYDSVGLNNGEITLLMDKTDDGPIMYSKPLRINKGDIVTIKQKSYIHPANRYFGGGLSIVSSDNDFSINFDKGLCTIGHFDYIYQGDWNTFVLQDRTNSENFITPVWNNWVEEELIYNTATGATTYKVGDKIITGYCEVANKDYIKLRIHSFGWWTGHYTKMDYIDVKIDSLK